MTATTPPQDPAAAAGHASVRVRQGVLHGVRRDGVSAYRGIPYALPPFGPRRFGAPVPVPAGDGDLDCTEFGPTVPKTGYAPPVDRLLPDPVLPGEDCLNLNVWTPARAGDPAALPVLVWIHGGAFVSGSGAVPQYDGHGFARDGVVCVTVNYRVGADGFLLLDEVPANRGLLDQVAALEWVRDNIAAFGGDPAQVTVAGQSAGAMSVAMLLAMPRAEGLFSRAVMQSGAGAQTLTPATARRVRDALAEGLDVPATAAALSGVPVDALLAAQARLARRLLTRPDPQHWGELTRNVMLFEPTVDGDVLPLAPLDAVRAGAGHDVAVLQGTNRDEMTLFLEPLGMPAAVTEEALPFLAGLYGLPAAGVGVYRAARPDAPAGSLALDVIGDWFFRVPMLRLAEARAAAAAPTYVYEFDWASPVWEGRLRATHSLEIGFVFDTLDTDGAEWLAGPNPPRELARDMHAAWVGFVRDGDPGWPVYGAQRRLRRFGVTGGMAEDLRGAERAAWEGLR